MHKFIRAIQIQTYGDEKRSKMILKKKFFSNNEKMRGIYKYFLYTLLIIFPLFAIIRFIHRYIYIVILFYLYKSHKKILGIQKKLLRLMFSTTIQIIKIYHYR